MLQIFGHVATALLRLLCFALQPFHASSSYGLFRRMTGVGDVPAAAASRRWGGLPPSVVKAKPTNASLQPKPLHYTYACCSCMLCCKLASARCAQTKAHVPQRADHSAMGLAYPYEHTHSAHPCSMLDIACCAYLSAAPCCVRRCVVYALMHQCRCMCSCTLLCMVHAACSAHVIAVLEWG